MIVAAAILDDGIIYQGKRHNNVIHAMVRVYGLPSPIKGIQGFVNEKGDFLTSEDAGKHAIECGQIKEMKYFGGKKLDSSDLW